MTDKLFLEDAFCQETEARVLSVTPEGGLILDQTIFYAASGGQPGDRGSIRRASGEVVAVQDTRFDSAQKETVVHDVAEAQTAFEVGETLVLSLEWERREKLMRMHTALHLLCSLIPHPVTGGSIGEEESRLDFDMPENPDKKELSDSLMALVEGDYPVSSRWVEERELDANPDLVRTMSVSPPRGQGRVRLVEIGEDGAVDRQPCGGTHVASTGSIGAIHVGKIEKKGKQNRRIRVRFGSFPIG
ncbi:alanyl-tRNA editing protein [Kiloniella sp. b19]|uniref:alanyl-tRNA editing protein n=1 Tax=Kiloniella sp. GXU_MW_B19 TaxID=3141326 RepID=UPI0031DA3CC5